MTQITIHIGAIICHMTKFCHDLSIVTGSIQIKKKSFTGVI